MVNRYFWCHVVLLSYCKEYLTMIKFKKPVLLQLMYWSFWGQPFFYVAFACSVNVYMVSVHTSST